MGIITPDDKMKELRTIFDRIDDNHNGVLEP